MLVEQNVFPGRQPETEGDPQTVTVLSYRDRGRERFPLVSEIGLGLDLRRQLESLDRWGFTMITLNDFRLFCAGELHLPRRPIILTFDQGSVDLAEVVYPALRDFGGPAVIFLSTGDDRNGRPAREGGPSGAVLPEQIRAMHARGIEFGSLMCSGRRLTDLPADEVMEELVVSKERLEQTLGSPVYSCAYPHGATSPAVKQLVKQAGYSFAVRGGTPFTLFGSDPFDICRQPVPSITGKLGFVLRVFGPHRQVLRLSRRTSPILSRRNAALEEEKTP